MLTEKQQENRKKGLGGSDIPAIMNQDPFKTPLDVFNEKVYGIEQEPNEAAYFGQVLETVIRGEFSKAYNLDVLVPEETKVHPKYSFALANLDGVIKNEKAILEIKNTSEYNAPNLGREETDEIPPKFLLQGVWYCFVCNIDICYFAILVGGNRLKYYKYTRNYELEERVLKAAKEFWYDHVLRENPPPCQSIADFDKKYESREGSVEADDELELLIREYYNLNSRKKQISEKMDNLKFQILEKMQDNSEVINKNGETIASYKKTKPIRKFDAKSFSKEYPDLYNNYIVEKPGQSRFQIKKEVNNDRI